MAEQRECPECGAPLGGAPECEALFHAALAMEWVDPPRTAEAHHLLVATYMLQHPSGFTPEGRAQFEAIVASSIDEGLTHQELRERNRGKFDQGKRDFNLRAKTRSEPVLRRWRMTIADAVDGPPDELPERVRRWARSVREELREQSSG